MEIFDVELRPQLPLCLFPQLEYLYLSNLKWKSHLELHSDQTQIYFVRSGLGWHCDVPLDLISNIKIINIHYEKS